MTGRLDIKLQAENVAKLDKKLKKNKTDVKVAKARDEMAKDLEVPGIFLILSQNLTLILTGEDATVRGAGKICRAGDCLPGANPLHHLRRLPQAPHRGAGGHVEGGRAVGRGDGQAQPDHRRPLQ